MEVLKSNFKEKSAIFNSLLQDTDLIAFDLEMAGINGDRTYGTDFPFEYFNKTYFAANKYQIIQVGFCLFHKLKTSSPTEAPAYKAFPFSFYVFPATVNGKMDKDLTLSLGSVEFNVNAGGVDWNKWIAQGLPYYDRFDLEKAKGFSMSDRYAIKPEYSYNVYGEEQTKAYEDLLEGFKLWHEREGNQVDCLGNVFDEEKQEEMVEMGKVFNVYSRHFNAVRKLKHWACKNAKEVKFLTFMENGENLLRAYKVDKKDVKELDEMYKEYQEGKFEEIKGFTLIWEQLKKVIKERKIPMIGHNSYGDVSFLMSHFEKRNTKDYVSYKKNVADIFVGGFFDTKNVAKHLEGEISRLSLGELYKFLNDNNNLTISLDKEFEFASGVLHNAGYDAFITGASFLHLSNKIPEAKLKEEKFKVKMWGVHNFMIDFGSLTSDQITTDKAFVILLNKTHLEHLKKNSQSTSMEGLISEFSKMYIEKTKKPSRPDKKYPKYDRDAFFAFVDAVDEMVKKSFKKNEIRVFAHPRAAYFEDNYMVTVEVEEMGNVGKLKEMLGDFGELVTLGDAYKIYFELYNDIFGKKEKKEKKENHKGKKKKF
jgi:hypothetical protein